MKLQNLPKILFRGDFMRFSYSLSKGAKFVFFALFLICPSLLIAQPVDVRKTRISAGDTIELKTLEINPELFPKVDVIFRAENQNKQPVWGLTADDMTVIEEEDTCLIVKFELLSKDMPVNVALVIDHSGSMEVADAFYHARIGITKLLENLSTEKDSVIIIGFSSGVDIITPLINDTTELNKALHSMVVSGGTAFFDALSIAIDSLEQHSGIKAIIALTDGEDNCSRYSRYQITKKGKDSGIPTYIIGLGLSEENRPQALTLLGLLTGFLTSDYLSEFAEELGGEAYFTTSSEKLTEIYHEISLKVYSIYRMRYISENLSTADTTRTVDFQVGRATTEYDKDKAKYILSDEILDNLGKLPLLYFAVPLGIIAGIILLFGLAKKDEDEDEGNDIATN